MRAPRTSSTHNLARDVKHCLPGLMCVYVGLYVRGGSASRISSGMYRLRVCNRGVRCKIGDLLRNSADLGSTRVARLAAQSLVRVSAVSSQSTIHRLSNAVP